MIPLKLEKKQEQVTTYNKQGESCSSFRSKYKKIGGKICKNSIKMIMSYYKDFFRNVILCFNTIDICRLNHLFHFSLQTDSNMILS